MKVWMIAFPVAGLLGFLGVAYEWSGGPEARRAEFVGQCIAVMDQQGQPIEVSKPVCDCVMDKGLEFKEGNPDADLSKALLGRFIVDCAAASGLAWENTIDPWR